MGKYTPVESAKAGIDVDTKDYYDDFALPPPHRLSTHYSPSPYHEALPQTNSNRNSSIFSGDSPYHTPSRPTSYAGSANGHYYTHHATSSFDNGRDYSPTKPTRFSAQSHEDTYAENAWHGPTAAMMSAPSLSQGLLSEKNDYEGYDEPVSWSAQAPGSAARDRYMQRREAGSFGGERERALPMSRKKKLLLIAAGVSLAVLIAIAVAVGVSVSKSKKAVSDLKTAGVVESKKNDPSDFEKDSRLKRSFYAMCYTPMNAQYPDCGATQANVTEDIQLLSQLTPRLRLYGADCGVSEMVLTAIEETKVNMSAWLALWVDDDEDTWQRQLSTTQTVLKKHGVDHVEGLIVGNEYVLNGGSITTLVTRINQVRSWVQDQKFDKTIQIATADAGSVITTAMAEAVDVVMANTHAWFAGTTIDDAAGWTWEYTNQNTPGIAVAAASNAPDLWIAETGWPTGANETAYETYEGAVAGTQQLQTFLDTFVCQANTNITTDATAGATGAGSYNKYAFFEAIDEPWKKMYGGVEPFWGLFDSNKQLKNVTIPDCAAP